MARDASDFPTEGQNFNTDSLLPPVDFLLKNLGSVQRKIGGKRPDFVPNFGDKTPSNEQMKKFIKNGMPSNNTVPDIPMGLNIQKEAAKTANNTALANINKHSVPVNYSVQPQYQFKEDTITFFKDSLGNQYKTVGEKLYVLGWQDADIKIRLVSDKTNKEVPISGKRFQFYGWHLVNKVTDKEEIGKLEKEDDIDKKLSSIRVESDEQNKDKNKTSEQNENVEVVKTESSKVKKNTSKKRLA